MKQALAMLIQLSVDNDSNCKMTLMKNKKMLMEYDHDEFYIVDRPVNLCLIYDQDMMLNYSLLMDIVVDEDDDENDVKHRTEINHFDDDVNDE
jgi:hypothetical protein